jgi:hypothetical protein
MVSEMVHEGLAATIEMDELSAVLKDFVLTCRNITQRFIKLLSRAKRFKERYSWLPLQSPYIDTLILLEFYSLMPVNFFLKHHNVVRRVGSFSRKFVLHVD